MALYHFSVKQVSRGKGQTVVNSAAYISGQKHVITKDTMLWMQI